MVFHKTSSVDAVADAVAKLLRMHLGVGEKVLWLVSGGSAIVLEVAVAKLLADADVQNLAVTLVDERYGEVGHADSNWQQLLDAGFDLPAAQLVPVLQGADRQATTEQFAQKLQELFTAADCKIGLFGLGPDGHTSGILPGSSALTAEGLVASYDGGAYQRITTTPTAIKQLDEALLFAMGEAKRGQLLKLQQDVPLAEQPAQILKQVARLTVYNDQIGQSV